MAGLTTEQRECCAFINECNNRLDDALWQLMDRMNRHHMPPEISEALTNGNIREAYYRVTKHYPFIANELKKYTFFSTNLFTVAAPKKAFAIDEPLRVVKDTTEQAEVVVENNTGVVDLWTKYGKDDGPLFTRRSASVYEFMHDQHPWMRGDSDESSFWDSIPEISKIYDAQPTEPGRYYDWEASRDFSPLVAGNFVHQTMGELITKEAVKLLGIEGHCDCFIPGRLIDPCFPFLGATPDGIATRDQSLFEAHLDDWSELPEEARTLAMVEIKTIHSKPGTNDNTIDGEELASVGDADSFLNLLTTKCKGKGLADGFRFSRERQKLAAEFDANIVDEADGTTAVRPAHNVWYPKSMKKQYFLKDAAVANQFRYPSLADPDHDWNFRLATWEDMSAFCEFPAVHPFPRPLHERTKPRTVNRRKRSVMYSRSCPEHDSRGDMVDLSRLNKPGKARGFLFENDDDPMKITRSFEWEQAPLVLNVAHPYYAQIVSQVVATLGRGPEGIITPQVFALVLRDTPIITPGSKCSKLTTRPRLVYLYEVGVQDYAMQQLKKNILKEIHTVANFLPGTKSDELKRFTRPPPPPPTTEQQKNKKFKRMARSPKLETKKDRQIAQLFDPHSTEYLDKTCHIGTEEGARLPFFCGKYLREYADEVENNN